MTGTIEAELEKKAKTIGEWWDSTPHYPNNQDMNIKDKIRLSDALLAVKKAREEILTPAKMFRKVMKGQIPEESLKPLLDKAHSEGFAAGKKEGVEVTARKIFEELDEKDRMYGASTLLRTWGMENEEYLKIRDSFLVGQAKK